MKLSNFIKGLTILSTYFDDMESYQTAAEHDEIYIYPTDRPVSEEDIKTLVELGWFQDGGVHEDAPDAYDEGESWKVYT